MDMDSQVTAAPAAPESMDVDSQVTYMNTVQGYQGGSNVALDLHKSRTEKPYSSVLASKEWTVNQLEEGIRVLDFNEKTGLQLLGNGDEQLQDTATIGKLLKDKKLIQEDKRGGACAVVVAIVDLNSDDETLEAVTQPVCAMADNEDKSEATASAWSCSSLGSSASTQHHADEAQQPHMQAARQLWEGIKQSAKPSAKELPDGTRAVGDALTLYNSAVSVRGAFKECNEDPRAPVPEPTLCSWEINGVVTFDVALDEVERAHSRAIENKPNVDVSSEVQWQQLLSRSLADEQAKTLARFYRKELYPKWDHSTDVGLKSWRKEFGDVTVVLASKNLSNIEAAASCALMRTVTNETVVYIKLFVTEREVRGQGLGRQLLRMCRSLVPSDEDGWVFAQCVNTGSVNEAGAKRFWSSCGMESGTNADYMVVQVAAQDYSEAHQQCTPRLQRVKGVRTDAASAASQAPTVVAS